MHRFAKTQPLNVRWRRVLDGLDRRQKESWARLLLSFALNIGLWFVFSGLSKWSTLDREFRLNLIGAGLAAPAIVITLPIFWRGIPWHAPLALLLLALPGYVIFSVGLFFYTYW